MRTKSALKQVAAAGSDAWPPQAFTTEVTRTQFIVRFPTHGSNSFNAGMNIFCSRIDYQSLKSCCGSTNGNFASDEIWRTKRSAPRQNHHIEIIPTGRTFRSPRFIITGKSGAIFYGRMWTGRKAHVKLTKIGMRLPKGLDTYKERAEA